MAVRPARGREEEESEDGLGAIEINWCFVFVVPSFGIKILFRDKFVIVLGVFGLVKNKTVLKIEGVFESCTE
jgi:hypothetical protein